MARKASQKSDASSAHLDFEDKLWIAADQFRTLATLRDTLLPKLLSGKLSVAAADL